MSRSLLWRCPVWRSIIRWSLSLTTSDTEHLNNTFLKLFREINCVSLLLFMLSDEIRLESPSALITLLQHSLDWPGPALVAFLGLYRFLRHLVSKGYSGLVLTPFIWLTIIAPFDSHKLRIGVHWAKIVNNLLSASPAIHLWKIAQLTNRILTFHFNKILELFLLLVGILFHIAPIIIINVIDNNFAS